jgi:hypothetical protein
MTKHSASHAKQHENAVKDQDTAELLKKLAADWEELDLVERGDRLKVLKGRGCTDHGLGKALHVDPKTISRNLRIAQLPAEQRARIAQGESATPFLRAQKNLQERPEVARGGQPKTRNPHKPDVGKLIQESRPQPGLAAKQDRVEPLINEVQNLKKRLSAVEASQESIRRGLNEDAASKALSGGWEFPTKRKGVGEGVCYPKPGDWPREMLKTSDEFEKKRKINLPRKV